MWFWMRERKEMVVNSCFEDLEGRVGMRRVCEFIPKAGKKRNERMGRQRTMQKAPGVTLIDMHL